MSVPLFWVTSAAVLVTSIEAVPLPLMAKVATPIGTPIEMVPPLTPIVPAPVRAAPAAQRVRPAGEVQGGAGGGVEVASGIRPTAAQVERAGLCLHRAAVGERHGDGRRRGPARLL